MTRNICYATPEWLIKQLFLEYGLTIDSCSTQANAVCARFWGPEEDGLLQSWKDERPYWNPPFDDVGAWVRKAYNEMKQHGVTSVGLVPYRKDKQWFQFAMQNSQMRLLRGGCLFFEGFAEQAGQTARIDPVIFVFGPDYPGHTTGELIVPPWKADTAKIKVPGIRMYTAPVNKPGGALRIYTYEELIPYLDQFAKGRFNFLVILGWPGLSKSTLIRARMPKSACWITGNTTPFKMYVALHGAIGEPVVMDDVDALLRKAGSTDLLKQLCETEAVKTLTWESDAALLKKRRIPNEFKTGSKVCFIANDWARLSSAIMALEDRALVLSFEPTATEVHEQVSREGWFRDKEIFEFIGENLPLIMRPSMRFYTRAKEMKAARLGWQSWLFRQWLEDEKLFRVAMLLADDSFASNTARAEAFVAAGHGARSTFFQRARELRSSRRPGRVIQKSGKGQPVEAVEVTGDEPDAE